jgi:hypothetical protein
MNKTGVAAAPSANAHTFSSEDLALRTVERRAVEAVIWGTPAVKTPLEHLLLLGR